MPFTSAQLSTSFPNTNDCLELKQQMEKLLNNINYWRKVPNAKEANASQFFLDAIKIQSDKNNCNEKINQQRGDVVSSIYDKYSSVDKIRIEAQSIKERNQRIIVGAGIFVIALGMIIAFSKKE
jgi:hypothetical protein